MSLRQSTQRFRCLHAAARQRVASLQQRSHAHRHSSLLCSAYPHTSPRLTATPSTRAIPSRRSFSTSPCRSDKPKTVQQARSRYTVGVRSFLLPSFPPCIPLSLSVSPPSPLFPLHKLIHFFRTSQSPSSALSCSSARVWAYTFTSTTRKRASSVNALQRPPRGSVSRK